MIIEPKKSVIRCRGIIINDGKLLTVRHFGDTSYSALPGGRLEWGEDIKESLRREIVEELGVEPKIGRLLYVHNFIDRRDFHSIEFLFEITNGDKYIECEKLARTHAHELADIAWLDPVNTANLRPLSVAEDFKAGKLLADETRLIRD